MATALVKHNNYDKLYFKLSGWLTQEENWKKRYDTYEQLHRKQYNLVNRKPGKHEPKPRAFWIREPYAP